MTEDGGKPNGATLPTKPEPDAHGQAALMLAESMLYILIEAAALTGAQAVEAVKTARSIKREMAERSGESATRMRESLELLDKIGASLAIDFPRSS